MMPEQKLVRGNDISLILNCTSEQEINMFFDKLSAGGKVKQALLKAFWGDTYGDLTDKFGIRWMFNLPKEAIA